MIERIKQIMQEENLSPSAFADQLNIGRATLSHILNGRNNPSLDVITRILETMRHIDSDWLLFGKGNMRRTDNIKDTNIIAKAEGGAKQAAGLFDSDTEDKIEPEPAMPTPEAIVDKELATNITSMPTNVTTVDKGAAEPGNITPKYTDKQVSKIIIYYTDNTFQAFNPDNNPL